MKATPKSASSRRLRIALILVAVLILSGLGWLGWQKYFGGPSVADQYQFATVQRGDVEDVVTATGTLQPREYVDVGAQVSGQLKVIHVEVGSEVKAGDLLAEIDATVLQSRVDATRAQLRNLRAVLMERESSLMLAEIQQRRQRNLFAENATTEEAMQQADAALRSARAQIEALRAQIDQTESNLRADEANLNYTRIFAPIGGTVVSILARQGQTLNAAQQAPIILRVADLSTMTVQTQVSEADVGRLRQGMEAYFTTLGNPGQRWTGSLRKIEPTPTVTNNVVLYNALFDVPNPDRRLMTQMTAQVFFVVGRAENALTVPMAAVSGLAPRSRPAAGEGAGAARQPGRGEGRSRAEAGAQPGVEQGAAPQGRRATVRMLDGEGAVVEREVRIGVTSRVAAQVLDGLNEGDQVVAGLRAAPGAAAAAAPGPLPRVR